MSVCHPDWRDRAACRGMSADLFLIPEHVFEGRPVGVKVLRRFARAKAICAACPVTAKCLADYMANPDPWMIAGGCTPSERRALRKAAS